MKSNESNCEQQTQFKTFKSGLASLTVISSIFVYTALYSSSILAETNKAFISPSSAVSVEHKSYHVKHKKKYHKKRKKHVSDDGDSSNSSNEDTSLKIALTDELDIDNIYCGGIDSACYSLTNTICASLFKPDSKGNTVPEVAKYYPTKANGGVSADGKTVTIVIRDNFKFSNGQPITPLDVKRSIERYIRDYITYAGTPYILENVEGLADVVGPLNEITGIVVDGNSLKFSLIKPDGSLPAQLEGFSDYTGCIWTADTPDFPLEEIYPNSGPYKIKQLASEEGNFILERNPFYPHGKSYAQPANFDEIEFVFNLEEGLDIDGVLDNQYDISNSFLFGFDTLRENHPDNLVELSLGGINYLPMNTEKWPTCNQNFRQALNFAIDRNYYHLVVNEGTNGFLRSTDQYVPPGITGHNKKAQRKPFHDYTGNIPAANARIQAFRFDMMNAAGSDEACQGTIAGCDSERDNALAVCDTYLEYAPQDCTDERDYCLYVCNADPEVEDIPTCENQCEADLASCNDYVSDNFASCQDGANNFQAICSDIRKTWDPTLPTFDPQNASIPFEFLSPVQVPQGTITATGLAFETQLEQDFPGVFNITQLYTPDFGSWFIPIEETGDFTITRIGYVLDYPDPANYLNPFLSSAGLLPGDVSNWARFTEYDAMFLQAFETTSPRLRDYRYRKINRKLVKEAAPWIPLSYYVQGLVKSNRIGCISTNRKFLNLGALCDKDDVSDSSDDSSS